MTKQRRKTPKKKFTEKPKKKFSKDKHSSLVEVARSNSNEVMSEKDRKKVNQIREKTNASIHQWLGEANLNASLPRQSGESLSLDPWQKQALDALLEGESVIVDAPTTAGKTRVIEAFFELHVNSPGFRAAYTAPVKSLSNDKLVEFREAFGRENVGIATGDIKENLHAPIVVATLESYRNSLLGVEPDLSRSLVVFDEYHFMQDSGRGSAWEEALILTPPNCQVVLLSASVDNPESFAKWIEKLSHRRCRLIRAGERPVPLVDLVFFKEQWLLGKDLAEQGFLRPDPSLQKFPLPAEETARRLKSTLRLGLSPCIVYAGRRLSCENMAKEICKHIPPLSPSESQDLAQFIENQCEIDAQKFMKASLRKMLLKYGVGYHHSGIAPAGRKAIEVLVKAGKLRFCVATMGLSIGINFSVRSALISDYKRPGESGFTNYSPSEVLQMLGRAGRRGRDSVGFSLWPSAQAYLKFSNAKREKVSSRLKNDPTTFLGLMGRGFQLRDIENFYEKSFLRFANKKVSFKLLRKSTLSKRLATDALPCSAPARDYVRYMAQEESSNCSTCSLKSRCHSVIQSDYDNDLAHLHMHLHLIDCIDENESLTEFGSVARYFPQTGGLVVARLVTNGWLKEANLLQGLEIMAAMSLARFKQPGCPEDYHFPYDADELEEALEDYYPLELFEELYDPPNPRRDSYILREFNPSAGFALRQWTLGETWSRLRARICHEKFGEGDLVNMIYRSASYLQSLSQAKIPQLSEAARQVRDSLLRDPISPTTGELKQAIPETETLE